jgi:hypothetical protein
MGPHFAAALCQPGPGCCGDRSRRLPFFVCSYPYIGICLDGFEFAITTTNEDTGASLAYLDCLFDGRS